MKINSFMTMTLAAMAFVLSVSSCSSNDDEPEVALATQVVGSYTGQEVIKVMGEDSSDGSSTYQFSKASDTSIDMMIPSSGESGMMIPALSVKNIPLAKVENSITGKLDSYKGTVTNAKGEVKEYEVSGLVVIFDDVPKGKAAVLTFNLKYGNMPFMMNTTFTGDKN